MSDTWSLFPPFGDPWPSCLLPSQGFNLALRGCLGQSVEGQVLPVLF